MNLSQYVSLIGAASGTVGSILTAFSLNSAISELNLARQGIETTVEGFVTNQRDIPVFKGFDKRFDRAISKSNCLVRIGVFLLSGGFILQAIAVITTLR
jgi:hypothetical protein